MQVLGKLSKTISKMLDFLVASVLIILVVLSTFSLYTTFKLYRGAYASDKLLALKPDPKEPLALSFNDLKSINPDVKAWITVEGTHIDYPVVQGKDNMEYINKDVYGNFAFSGAVFLDSRLKDDFSNPYNLLYAHHMEKGAMFGDLEKFLKKDFFDHHKKGQLITEEGYYEIDFFEVIEADGYDGTVFNPSYIENTSDRDALLSYIGEKAIQKRDIKIDPEDKIIGLSTCTSTKTNGRTILYGVIRSKEERREK